jgi:hypothetical protein
MSRMNWELPVSPPRDRFEPLRDPVRAGVLVAGALIVIASAMPWGEGSTPNRPHLEISGYVDAGDGVITLLAGLIAIVWAYRRSAFESRVPVVVLAPLLVGVGGLILTRVAVQNAEVVIRTWLQRQGEGGIGIGLWLTGLGFLALALVGAVHVWRVRSETSFRFALSPSDLGAVIGAVGGAIAGGAAAMVISGLLISQDRPAVFASTQIFILIPLVFVGAWIGSKIGRVIGDGFRPMPPSDSSSTRV